MKNPYKNTTEIVTRAIIEDRGKILLCKNKKKDYYYFPGGHVDFGERIEEALIREIKEELNIKVKGLSFMGVIDNVFVQEGEKHFEINFIFKIKVDKIHSKSNEDHLEFIFFDKKKLMKEKKIYPTALKKQLLKKSKNKQIFWIKQ